MDDTLLKLVDKLQDHIKNFYYQNAQLHKDGTIDMTGILNSSNAIECYLQKDTCENLYKILETPRQIQMPCVDATDARYAQEDKKSIQRLEYLLRVRKGVTEKFD